MTRFKMLGLLSLSLALGACSTATSEPRHVAASSGCDRIQDSQAVLDTVYAPGNVYSVRKVEQKEFIARAIQPKRTMGADMYVHAPAVSQGYLQRVLACHVAGGKAAHVNDPLHPTSGAIADVTVRTVGDSLAVRVVGEDARTGREILQRAEAIAAPGGDVTVEQVASVGAEVSTL
jgi:hypothetical protein